MDLLRLPAAVKSQNGAAMSFGRTSSFRISTSSVTCRRVKSPSKTHRKWLTTVMKLRMVRFLRTPEYDELFSGDPIWATESIGGMGVDGRTLVTKTASAS